MYLKLTLEPIFVVRRDEADSCFQRGERPASNHATVSRARHQALPVPQGHHT